MNKTKIYLIIFGIFSIGVFSACERIGDNQELQNTATETVTKEVSSDQTGDLQMTLPVAPTTSDQTSYNGAMQLLDQEFCTKISDEAYKARCMKDLSDRVAQNEAIDKKDPNLCDNLSTDDLKTSCRTKLEIRQKSEQKEADLLKATDETETLMQTALDTSNIADCQRITNSNAKFDCEFNILLNNAINAQDKQACQEGSSDELRQACELDYERMK